MATWTWNLANTMHWDLLVLHMSYGVYSDIFIVGLDFSFIPSIVTMLWTLLWPVVTAWWTDSPSHFYCLLFHVPFLEVCAAGTSRSLHHNFKRSRICSHNLAYVILLQPYCGNRPLSQWVQQPVPLPNRRLWPHLRNRSCHVLLGVLRWLPKSPSLRINEGESTHSPLLYWVLHPRAKETEVLSS